MGTPFLFKMISIIFYIFGATLILPITCIEIYHSRKHTLMKSRFFNILSLIVYISYLLQITGALSSLLIFDNAFGCRYISSIIIAIHFPCRGFYFSIFIARIYIIFGSTPMLNYPKKLIYSLFVTVICFAILLSFVYIFNHLSNSYFDATANRCMSPIPIYLLGITALYDLSFNILTLYLFISKLRQMMHAHSTAAVQQEDLDGLNKVILKSTVLVLVSVLTSFVIAGIYGPMLAMGLDIIATDWVVNCICIALMKKDYDAYYSKLCVYPTKCVRCCCMRSMRSVEDVHNLNALQLQNTKSGTSTVHTASDKKPTEVVVQEASP